jgi:hypothetical protein
MSMSVSAISQANGADLLSLLNQSTGQAPAGTASVDVLKKAIAQAQLSESQIIGGNTPDSGSQLNVFA